MIVSLVSCNQSFLPIVCNKLVLDLLPPKSGEEEEDDDFVVQESDLTGPMAEPIIIQIIGITPLAPSCIIEVGFFIIFFVSFKINFYF